MTCNLLLVDDHLLIRAGVKALVNDLPGYAVVGELDDGNQLLETAERLNPDIILLDLSMRCTGGLEALRHLKTALPHSKVLILSMHTDPQLIMQTLESGARGYLLKDTSAVELEQALEAMRRNESYLSPAIAHTVIDQALKRGTHRAQPATKYHNLTERQLEILRLIVRGKSTREIACGLNLSIKTVETHRAHIMKRLQIHDVAGLVLYAVREHIISLDD